MKVDEDAAPWRTLVKTAKANMICDECSKTTGLGMEYSDGAGMWKDEYHHHKLCLPCRAESDRLWQLEVTR